MMSGMEGMSTSSSHANLAHEIPSKERHANAWISKEKQLSFPDQYVCASKNNDETQISSGSEDRADSGYSELVESLSTRIKRENGEKTLQEKLKLVQTSLVKAKLRNKQLRGQLLAARKAAKNKEDSNTYYRGHLQIARNSSAFHLLKNLPPTYMLPVIPINDFKDTKSSRDGEQLLKCKLAALYRLVDLCGWSHGIYNHISVRVDGSDDHFLINPFGMLYSEITASSLVKVDLNGDVIDSGSSQFGVNKAGFTLHSAIHEGRPDVKCIIHLHTPPVVAVSAMKCGLLPISQEALVCGNVSYHDYQGIVINEEEKKTLVKDLGPTNKIMMLRNHGIAACGTTIEEAFHLVFNILAACETQIRAVPYGVENIVVPSDEAREQANRVANMGGGGVDTSGKSWKTGQLEFEALMRALDNLGYRTGYDYKLLPLQKVGS